MDEQTILEMIGMIADMDNIHVCEIEKEGIRIRIEKPPIRIETESVSTPKEEVVEMKGVVETEGFSTAANFTPAPPDEVMASPGQVKYARDMMTKEFGDNYGRARDFLAHVWELPIQDVPSMETWETTLTRNMAGAILDYMEHYKRSSKYQSF